MSSCARESTEPVPLVSVGANGCLTVRPEAGRLIEEIEGDIGVVCIAGCYRTGKSYIMNRLLGRQSGFAVGPTVNPCTRGVYVWGSPIRVATRGERQMSVILVDTEGLGSVEKAQTHDIKIFSLAVLMASYFVYNSVGVIDERALDSLSLVTNLVELMSAKASPRGREVGYYFPDFLWLLRDFTLQLRDEEGRPMTAAQYLEGALRERPGEHEGQRGKNRIRESIKRAFRRRDCFTIVRPVEDESKLQSVDAVEYGELRPEFRRQCEQLVRKVFEEVRPKQVYGKNMTGSGLVEMLRRYVKAMNTGGIPSIESTWDSISMLENRKVMEQVFQQWKKSMHAKLSEAMSEEKLGELYEKSRAEAREMFESERYAGGEETEAYMEALQGKMRVQYEGLVKQNQDRSAQVQVGGGVVGGVEERGAGRVFFEVEWGGGDGRDVQDLRGVLREQVRGGGWAVRGEGGGVEEGVGGGEAASERGEEELEGRRVALEEKERELKGVRGELEERRRELEERRRELKGVRGELEERRRELKGVRGELEGVRGELEGVRGELEGVRGELEGVRGELEGVRASWRRR
ncbi:guanylate-binding protein 4-like [Schistocerca gregaria]|uniref:guanylate-binding protein 4-like n=1 Tax=Schistocerca gregaria TaxID=7010 RepID=UPI00211EB96F|nr:guanylate-binding protein 4-like [Schistocerca gregaria]